MFKFFDKNKLNNSNENKDLLLKTTSLLIHAAKIDENYTEKEKEIIRKTLEKLSPDKSEIDQIMLNAERDEENSNQILDYTREIKNANEDFKIQVVETLWSIIYSNNDSDIYESNLMRRLSGLLYIDNKLMADIKERIKKNLL